MSMDWCDDVVRFHEAFAPERIGVTPAIPPPERLRLIMDLIREEHTELWLACINGDLVAMADAMADGIYVILGAAACCGIDLRPVWDAVHAANLRKTGGSKRADGKVLKGPDWVAPDIAGILARQGPLARRDAPTGGR